MSATRPRTPIGILPATCLGLLVLALANRVATGSTSGAVQTGDVPISIAATEAGQVWVGFTTDRDEARVGRFTADGDAEASWGIAPVDPTRQMAPHVAATLLDAVYVAVPAAGAVYEFGPEGSPLVEWSVPGLVPGIATGPPLGAMPFESVYTLVASGPGERRVVRHSATGWAFAQWPVHRTAFDVAVGRHPESPEGIVYVADRDADGPVITPGSGHIARYRPDGSAEEAWPTDGEVVAVDASAGDVWVALVPERPDESAALARLDTAGAELGRCPLAGVPVDVAAAPEGRAYVIERERGADPRDARAVVVRRFGPDCTLEATWDEPLLRAPGATPTASTAAIATASPTAGQTPAATPSRPPDAGRLALPLLLRGR